jgi:NADPH:quinone reductase-like Zn-dependent oxidoreductase
MPHAIQIRQTGGPEVLNWTPIEVGEPGSGQVRINVNQRFALKDAADAHKALEARATSGSTILTI